MKFKRNNQVRAGIAIQLHRKLLGRRRGEHLAPAKIKLNFHTCKLLAYQAKCKLVTHRQTRQAATKDLSAQ